MKFFLTLLLLPFALFANAKEEPFTIGTTSGYAPFVSLNDQGEYEGFDIDLAHLLAQKLGKTLSIKDYGSLPGLMLALKQGKVDALIWAISITAERQKMIEMIYYQGEQVREMPVIFWKKIPENIRSFEDLAKSSVSVEAGSFQESVLRKYPGIEIKNLASLNDAVMDLKYGKSTATCIDPSLLSRFQKRYPDLKTIQLPLPLEEQSAGNGICIQKTNTQLISQIRKAIDELKAEGKIKELEKKWNLK
jgi:ABC-type amino acid transport substrate-binding protein